MEGEGGCLVSLTWQRNRSDDSSRGQGAGGEAGKGISQDVVDVTATAAPTAWCLTELWIAASQGRVYVRACVRVDVWGGGGWERYAVKIAISTASNFVTIDSVLPAGPHEWARDRRVAWSLVSHTGASLVVITGT